MIKHIAFLLISILPAQAGTIPLKKGDSVSEILYHEYSIGTPGHPQRLYGEKGMVKKVFELNHLPIEKANKMKSGFLLKLPDEIMNPRSEIPVSLPSATMEEAPEVKTLPMQVAVNEPPAVIQEASAVEPTTPEPDNAGVDVIEAGMKWKWRKPNFVLLGGTYLSNKANASHKTSGATNALSRNIEPMVGGEITLRWGQEGYSFEAISRAMFNKNQDDSPSIPMEFVWQERLIYPGLKLARVFVPYFDLEYEKFYFNQPGLGGARLTKSQGFWGGIGLHLPLSFWENTFRFYFSYLQAVSVNADGNGESKDFSGYQFHYWVRYNRVGPLFWELHGLNHSAKTTSYNLSTQKSYVLLGIEF